MKTLNETEVKQVAQRFTKGCLTPLDGALLSENVNDYGNFIIASCARERTPEDNANIERLAACWNAALELPTSAVRGLRLTELLHQRYELLEACKAALKVVSEIADIRSESRAGFVHRKIVSAIEKAGGAQ